MVSVFFLCFQLVFPQDVKLTEKEVTFDGDKPTALQIYIDELLMTVFLCVLSEKQHLLPVLPGLILR